MCAVSSGCLQAVECVKLLDCFFTRLVITGNHYNDAILSAVKNQHVKFRETDQNFCSDFSLTVHF